VGRRPRVRARPRLGGRGLKSIALALALAGAVALSGCGSGKSTSSISGIPRDLLLEARPIGLGEQFHPPARGPVIPPCRSSLGPRQGVHIELFAANRVVIVPAGIGVRGPLVTAAGRITHARCYGQAATLEPTGLVLVRPGSRHTVSDLFGSWRQPLSKLRLGPFRPAPGHEVEVFVDGRRWKGPPGRVPLSRHSEIVLEVGPHVPPHKSYTFPPGT
jgi:hypothetical protein